MKFSMEGKLDLRVNEGPRRDLNVGMTAEIDLAEMMRTRDFHVVDGKAHIHLDGLVVDLTIPEEDILREMGIASEVEQELLR